MISLNDNCFFAVLPLFLCCITIILIHHNTLLMAKIYDVKGNHWPSPQPLSMIFITLLSLLFSPLFSLLFSPLFSLLFSVLFSPLFGLLFSPLFGPLFSLLLSPLFSLLFSPMFLITMILYLELHHMSSHEFC